MIGIYLILFGAFGCVVELIGLAFARPYFGCYWTPFGRFLWYSFCASLVLVPSLSLVNIILACCISAVGLFYMVLVCTSRVPNGIEGALLTSTAAGRKHGIDGYGSSRRIVVFVGFR